MGKRYIDSGVQCPYYCSEEPSKIYCEGIEEGCWVHVAWGDEKRKKKYKQERCRCNWRECPVAKINMARGRTSGG
ncbi:MAG: hypothetical protein ACI3XG_02895 [Faecousia sp.]